MVFLFVHVIWCVRGREALLNKPVRRVLFAHLQKEGEEKGIRSEEHTSELQSQ